MQYTGLNGGGLYQAEGGKSARDTDLEKTKAMVDEYQRVVQKASRTFKNILNEGEKDSEEKVLFNI